MKLPKQAGIQSWALKSRARFLKSKQRSHFSCSILCNRRIEWIPAAEIRHLWRESQWKIWAYGQRKWESLHCSANCFLCKPFGMDNQTLLWRSPGCHPVKMKPDRREVFLLLLGLPINPSYLQLAWESPLLVPSVEGQAPGMLRPELTTILSPNTLERQPPPHHNLWSSCVLGVLFFPCSLFSRLLLPGYLRD